MIRGASQLDSLQICTVLKGLRTNLRCPFRAMIGCVHVTWGDVHPHSRIHLPQAGMLSPVGAKHNFSGLKGHGMSARGNALG